MKSHRRRRRLRLRQCTLTVPPTVQIGVVRIDQCSPGYRRERILPLSITADRKCDPILRWRNNSDIWSSELQIFSLTPGWTFAVKLRRILGAKYQMRLQIVKIIFFSQILMKLDKAQSVHFQNRKI